MNLLFGLLAIVCAVIAGYIFYSIREDTGTMTMVFGGILIILTILFGAMFLKERVNKTEEIHITE